MHNAGFSEKLLLGWRQCVSSQKGVSGFARVEVEIYTRQNEVGVKNMESATFPPQGSRARMSGPSFHDT